MNSAPTKRRVTLWSVVGWAVFVIVGVPMGIVALTFGAFQVFLLASMMLGLDPHLVFTRLTEIRPVGWGILGLLLGVAILFVALLQRPRRGRTYPKRESFGTLLEKARVTMANAPPYVSPITPEELVLVWVRIQAKQEQKEKDAPLIRMGQGAIAILGFYALYWIHAYVNTGRLVYPF